MTPINPNNPISPNNLINSTIKNNLLAFRIIQTYLNNPSIAGVTIQQVSLTKTYPTEVSKQVILDSAGGRKVIHDNFALQPIGWKLEGYLKPAFYEVSFYFQPSLKTKLKQLEEARDSRETVEFKDQNGQKFQVGISKMAIEEVSDTRNAIPISFELVDVTIQEANSVLLEKDELSGITKEGDKKGLEKSLGEKSGKRGASHAWTGSKIVGKAFGE